MGRHKQIETMLLLELTSNEERSQRSMQIINHQRSAIYKLQKELKENAFVVPLPPPNHDSEALLEDYHQIQNEVLELQSTLRELEQVQKQITKDRECSSQSLFDNQTNDNSRLALKQVRRQQRIDIPSDVNLPRKEPGDVLAMNNNHASNLPSELQTINKKLETGLETETDLKRKLEVLQEKVGWLKKELMSHMQKQLKWRSKVEMQLCDLSVGISEEDDDKGDGRKIECGDMSSRRSRNAWRNAARTFFTAEEAQFFLSGSQK